MPNDKFKRIQVGNDLAEYEQEQRAINANKKDLYTNYDRRSITTNLSDPNVRQYIENSGFRIFSQKIFRMRYV